MAQCRECGRDFIENRPFQVFCDSRCKGVYHRRKYKQQAREQAVQRQSAGFREETGLAEDASLAEKVREALANIEIDIPANATRAKHKCKGCGRSTTNERFCSARRRMKFFSRDQDVEADNGRKFVRRI